MNPHIIVGFRLDYAIGKKSREKAELTALAG